MIRKIMHRPQAVLGLAMMLLVFLVMLLAPVFAPNDPMQLNVAHSFAPPDAQYPLGTDELGRCILSRLIYGARASLSIALPTLLLLAVISTVVATLCAYIGGVLDRIFEVVSNIFMAFPPFLVAITLVGLFESKAASIVLSIVIAMWVWNARVVHPCASGAESALCDHLPDVRLFGAAYCVPAYHPQYSAAPSGFVQHRAVLHHHYDLQLCFSRLGAGNRDGGVGRHVCKCQ